MEFRFWGFLILIQQARSMENPFDLAAMSPTWLDSFSEISRDLDFYWNFNQFAADPLDLPLSVITPSDTTLHPTLPAALPPHESENLLIPHDQLDHSHVRHDPSHRPSPGHDELSENLTLTQHQTLPAALPPHELENLLIPHDQLDHNHVRHDPSHGPSPGHDELSENLTLTHHQTLPAALPPHETESLIIPHDQLDHSHMRHHSSQPSIDHDELSGNGSMRKKIRVQLPQVEHPSPPSSSIQQLIHSSQPPSPTRNTGTSPNSDFSLPEIQPSFSLVHPEDFYQTEGQSNLLEMGDPRGPKVVNHLGDGLDTNHCRIRPTVENDSPKPKRKFATKGAGFVGSDRDAQKLCSIRNDRFNDLNRGSPLRPNDIAHFFPRIPVRKTHCFAYKLIVFEPVKIDGMIVLEAIENLKIPNGTKFFNLPTSYIHSQNQGQTKSNEKKYVHKLFCLNPSKESRFGFYNFFHSFSRSKEGKGIPRSANEKRVSRGLVARRAWGKWNGKENHNQNPSFLSYKTLVLSDFAQSISWFEGEIERYFGADKLPFILKVYNALIEQFPVYLLYVDMINATSPVGKVDHGGEFLHGPRMQAGKIFFKVLYQTLFFKKAGPKPEERKTEIILELKIWYKNKYFIEQAKRFGILWKFLEYWILSERSDLEYETGLPNRWKGFYNCLVFGLLNHSKS